MTHNAWYQKHRLAGLRRFALAITVLNILGHTFLGFEQSPAHPLVALGVAYSVELLLEWLDARSARRRPRYSGGFGRLVDFLLSAHITAMAISMLLYPNQHVMPVAFACAVAIASKSVLRIRMGSAVRHFMNPSNFGISATLVLFPWVGIAPPYQFTANVFGALDWILPAIIVVSGTFLNARYTKRVPLLCAWLGAFVLQAVVRNVAFATPLSAALVPMSGMAFVLFTFYMITDPATTPSATRSQVLFGVATAATYGLLMVVHVVFGLFFALTIVTLGRGAAILLSRVVVHTVPAEQTEPLPTTAQSEWSSAEPAVRERVEI